MKISVTQENLHKALSHIIKATANKPNIPVLANVLIKTESGKVKFIGTDLDISISAWIGGDIAEDGEVTVNARLLAEFVGQLKASRVDLIQTGQTLEVKSVDNQAELYIIPADDFPNLPESENQPDLVVRAQDFRDAIEKTSFAAATDQSRPILTGLLLECTKKKAALVGVDGFRLSKKVVELVKAAKDETKVVVPAKALLELAKIIPDTADHDDNVNIFLLEEKNQVIFKINEVTLTSRILEGDFPDYKQIIPADKTTDFQIEREELSQAIKIASIFARNVMGNKTFFKVNVTDKKLVLSAKVLDVGNNESTADMKKVEGEDFETAYNAKFMSDMISAMKGDVITFESNGITSPGVFKDSDDKDFLHIIMPMRIE